MRRCNCNCNQNCNCHFNPNNSDVFENNCKNMQTAPFPENYLYGHAYTPVQNLDNTFIPELGLKHGSIFPELVSPYSPGQSIDFIEFLRQGGMQNE